MADTRDSQTEGDIWNEYKEQRRAERERVEPSRVNYATKKLMDAGYAVSWNAEERKLCVWQSQNRRELICHIFPYTGWWSGKGIGSERGLKKLIKKLKEMK